MSSNKIQTGKNLTTFLQVIVEESVKSALHQRSLQEKEKQDMFSGGDDSSEGEDSSEPSKTMSDDADDDNVDADDDDADVMKSGEVSVDDVIEKLNSIRSGHSFRDEKVKGNMEQYVNSLSKAEKTALLTFLKGISQIITGEISSEEAVEPSDNPSDVTMKKGAPAPKTKHITPNVIKAKMPITSKKPSAEDTSGPMPITPKKK